MYHCSRARGKATSRRSEAGSRSRQLPARLITRIAARIGGDARARSASRTAASPGGVPMTATASASATKPPPAASSTQRALLRRDELGATTTAVPDEPQHPPATPLVERDAAVAVGAFVADPPL